jgi:hypothetical protein
MGHLFKDRRIPLEYELISTRPSGLSVGTRQLSLNFIDIAFMIRCDLVAWRMRLGGAHVE